MRCLGLAAVLFCGCPPHAMSTNTEAFVAGGTSLSRLLRSSLRPADPSASVQRNAYQEVHLASRTTSFLVSLVLRLFSVPLQTFQHLCSRSHLPTVHTGLPGTSQKSTSARVPPWLRWQQACPLVQRQRPRILRKWRHGPIDDARRAPGVDPSRCSSISMMIPETRPTQRVHTKRRRARGRGRRQGRGHGHRRPGQEGH